MKIANLIKELTDILLTKGNVEIVVSVKDKETADYKFGNLYDVVPYDDGTVGLVGKEEEGSG